MPMELLFQNKYTINFIAIVIALFSCVSNATETLEKVSLRLDWKYQFEFAGFIMAKEKGFYREAGLDVELIEYQEGVDTVEEVLTNRNNYGVNNSTVIVDEGKIKPIILMATYFHKSPLVFITNGDISIPTDLIGKKVMGTQAELKYSSLALMLDHFFINERNTKFQNHTFNSEDFLQNKINAMTAFRTNEVFFLDEKKIEYNILDPADYGFSMSSVNLFTSFSETVNHPERTRRFIDASNKGWAYALAHEAETISMIHTDYAQYKSREALEFEAKTSKEMMLLDFFDIGEVNEDLSRRMVKQLQYSGALPETENLGDFLFEDVVREFVKGAHFTAQQNKYLQEKKEITLCIDPDWMPLESIKDGKHIGISADIIALFKQNLPIPIKLFETKSWRDSLDKVIKRDCDIISLAVKSPQRSQYMDFTSPYIKLPIVLATKVNTPFINDIADVKNEKIGVVDNYVIADILRERIPDINIVDVASISEGLALVESGELFGYIDNLMVISNLIQKSFTGVLKVSSRLEDKMELALASRNDQPQLNNIFEMLVHSLSDEELQATYNKWVSVGQERAFDYSLLWKILAAVMVLTVGYFYYYWQLKKFNKKLLVLSTTDTLTGIYNRLKVDALLVSAKSSIERYGQDVSIILLDIDHFKAVNDNYGHLVGDDVLIKFARILTNNIRGSDFVGRWGGEEFIVICPHIKEKEAVILAEKLLAKIRETIFDEVGSLTASAGVTQFSTGQSVQDAMNEADKLLYKSKDNGRDQISSS